MFPKTQFIFRLLLTVSASSFLNFTLILFLWQDNWQGFETFFFFLYFKFSSLLEHSLQAKAIYAETFSEGLNHDLRTDL